MEDQRRVLDFSRIPLIILHRIDPQKYCVCKDEAVHTELGNQERNSTFNEELPEPWQIKGGGEDTGSLKIKQEQEEQEHQLFNEEERHICTTQVEKQFVLKHKTGDILRISSNVQQLQNEMEPNRNQLKSQASPEVASQCQGGNNNEDPGKRSVKQKQNEKGEKTKEQERAADISRCKINKKNQPGQNIDYSKIGSEKNFSQKSHLGTLKTNMLFTCTACGMGYRNKRSLTYHMKFHTDEKPFTCTACGRSYRDKSGLTCHMRTHTGEKPFTCTACGKSYRQKGGLTGHMKSHTDEKPFSCTTCGKSYRQKMGLIRHMKNHTGEKPFSCTTCGKSYRDKVALVVHLRTHTGEKPFTCSTCGKSYTKKFSLIYHMRTHTGEKPFTCTECGMSFTQKFYLTCHMRSHTDEKPFTCTACGKCYRDRNGLNYHMRTHTDETPSTCTACGKSYRTKIGLAIHMRTHR